MKYVLGVFNVLTGVSRGHCNISEDISNAWLKSTTSIFNFHSSPTLFSISKFTGGITKGISTNLSDFRGNQITAEREQSSTPKSLDFKIFHRKYLFGPKQFRSGIWGVGEPLQSHLSVRSRFSSRQQIYWRNYLRNFKYFVLLSPHLKKSNIIP